METSRRLSLVELLLPAGRATAALVLGSACPPRLQPAAERGGDADPVDLVVVAPSEEECRRPGWLEDAASTCAGRLSEDGLAYVLVPRRWRSRARRLLRGRGLGAEVAVLHLPNAVESLHLVPLEPAPARHAFARIVPLVPWKRVVASVALALRGAWVIASSSQEVALVARRPGARPLFGWLPVPGVPDAKRRSVVVSASWRGEGASVVLHPFAAGASPPVVAKLSLAADAGPAAEGGRLERLGPTARRAGAAVPAPLPAARLDGAPVLLETRVDGEILAPQIVLRPRRLERGLARVCAWLEAWQGLTATSARLTQDQLESEVLGPARLLAPHLDGGAEYAAALEAQCAAAADAPVRLADAHNDLTMWNVLVDRRGRLGIVDWEVAEEATLPLKDFFYAAVDAVAATRRYVDRPWAFRECFGAGGAHAERVRTLQALLASAVDASPQGIELAFHACWLGHAANELRSAADGDPMPFREIVQALAWGEFAIGS